jgi:fructosamine-3-kinase
MKQAILDKFNVGEEEFLGEGGEAWVYNLGESKVLRIYKGRPSLVEIQRLQAFYRRLNTSKTTFSVPAIENVAELNGDIYTVDNLIPGTEFGKALGTLDGLKRQHALESFWRAAQEVKLLANNDKYFGEELAEQPIRTMKWPDFLRQKALSLFRTTRQNLVAEIPYVDKVMLFFQKECDIVDDVKTGSLVHGDYYPGNVFISEMGDICGVADFYALSGDSRMDLAGAILFLEVVDNATPEDAKVLLDKAVEQYGNNVISVIYLYRLYYCFRFSDCKESDPRTYKWCVSGLKDAASKLVST